MVKVLVIVASDRGLSTLFSTPLHFESNPSQHGCWFPDLRQSPDPI